MDVKRILSDEVVERLEFLGRVASDAQWEIGRLTLRIIEVTEAHNNVCKPGEFIGLMDVYNFVEKLTGKRDRSIRRYVAACRFYAPEVVDEFDVLPFEYFAEAMAYPHQWRNMLEASMRAMDSNGGYPPGVAWMTRLHSAVDMDDPGGYEYDESPVEGYEMTLSALVNERSGMEADVYDPTDGIGIVGSFLDIAAVFQTDIAKLPVSSESKAQAMRELLDLMDRLSEIVKLLSMETAPSSDSTLDS